MRSMCLVFNAAFAGRDCSASISGVRRPLGTDGRRSGGQAASGKAPRAGRCVHQGLDKAFKEGDGEIRTGIEVRWEAITGGTACRDLEKGGLGRLCSS